MSAANNRRRAFADVVTIDAWHKPFGAGVESVDLHADVVFGTARVGGELDSPVRFRLSMKRAEVVVVIPEHEPVSVDKASVSRDSPMIEGQIVETIERKKSGFVHAGANVGGSATGCSASVTLGAGGGGRIDATRRTESVTPLQLMFTIQTRTAEGHYRWEIEGADEKALSGRPWSADSPRLRLIDQRLDRTKGLPPTVRVEVRCRREDLVIEDLVLKSKETWEGIKARAGFKNRMAAAISYIRSQLLREGLEANNLQDPFGELTIGSVLAEHG